MIREQIECIFWASLAHWDGDIAAGRVVRNRYGTETRDGYGNGDGYENGDGNGGGDENGDGEQGDGMRVLISQFGMYAAVIF